MTAAIDHDHDLLSAIRRCPFCARYLCAVCDEPVGKRTKARWTNSHRIVCLSCCDRRGREAHRAAFPDCPEWWHDVEDHGGLLATQGGLRRMISESAT